MLDIVLVAYIFLTTLSDLTPTAKNTDTEAHPELSKTNTGSIDSDSETKKASVKLAAQKKVAKEEVTSFLYFSFLYPPLMSWNAFRPLSTVSVS